MPLCCGTRADNVFQRLRTTAVLCLANDSAGTWFYGIGMLWGFSGSGLADSADKSCYEESGYYGHIVAGISCLISMLGCIAGAATALTLMLRLDRGSLARRLKDSTLLRTFYHVFLFESVWMWVAYCVEVFYGYTIPLGKCHPERLGAPRRQGAGDALVSVLLTACWGCSCALRGSAVFYAFEIIHSKGHLQGIGAHVIGRPMTFGAPTMLSSAAAGGIVPTVVVGAASVAGRGAGTVALGRPPAQERGGAAAAADMPPPGTLGT